MKKIRAQLRNTRLILIYRKILHLYYSFKFRVLPNEIIQIANTTRYNRHPDLYEKCQEVLGKESQISILSFGCSTGEECFSLQYYFPNATIIGCDINKKSIKKARQKNSEKNIVFMHSSKANLDNLHQFDIIVALSVFCKEPEARVLNNLSNLFPFTRFNERLNYFDSKLKNNGLLVIRNANYRITDTDIFTHYNCIYQSKTSFPIFNKEGIKLQETNKICEIAQKK